MQVLARVQPFVRLLGCHHCLQGGSCALCKIRMQIADMRGGSLIERSPVVLAARACEFRHRLADEFMGDAQTGAGNQCDVWEFFAAVVDEFERWERERKQSRFREDRRFSYLSSRLRDFDRFLMGSNGF